MCVWVTSNSKWPWKDFNCSVYCLEILLNSLNCLCFLSPVWRLCLPDNTPFPWSAVVDIGSGGKAHKGIKDLHLSAGYAYPSRGHWWCWLISITKWYQHDHPAFYSLSPMQYLSGISLVLDYFFLMPLKPYWHLFVFIHLFIFCINSGNAVCFCFFSIIIESLWP